MIRLGQLEKVFKYYYLRCEVYQKGFYLPSHFRAIQSHESKQKILPIHKKVLPKQQPCILHV